MSFSVAEWTDIVLALAIVSSDTEVKEERQKDFLNLAKKVNANLNDFGDTIIGKIGGLKMYRGKYKICWTRDIETLDVHGRVVTVRSENFGYYNDSKEVAQTVRSLLNLSAYDLWIEEVKNDEKKL